MLNDEGLNAKKPQKMLDITPANMPKILEFA